MVEMRHHDVARTQRGPRLPAGRAFRGISAQTFAPRARTTILGSADDRTPSVPATAGGRNVMAANPPLSQRFSPGQHAGSRLDASAIRHLAFFAGLDAAACDDIAGTAHAQRVPQGEPLFRQGELPHALYMVLSGEFKATQVTAEGDRVVVRLVGPGDLAGHVSAFCDKPYPATPIAMTDSVVLQWSLADFKALMARHPALSLAVIRNMAKAIENAHTRLREAATERVERRIAHALLRLIQQSGHRADDRRDTLHREPDVERLGAARHRRRRSTAPHRPQAARTGAHRRGRSSGKGGELGFRPTDRQR